MCQYLCESPPINISPPMHVHWSPKISPIFCHEWQRDQEEYEQIPIGEWMYDTYKQTYEKCKVWVHTDNA